ncbi:NDP-hexose 2,3-dehydratase family protein [Streptomyces sp. NPDC000345]|uniref:NDP-hexose 2,3-dehydratase family protein n=1 Tax=Streptomyces sp. NPDC000345 TaxID=3364537 RepID=UPI00368C49DB
MPTTRSLPPPGPAPVLDTVRRFEESAALARGTAGDFDAWFRQRSAQQRADVCLIPFADLDGWSFEPSYGDLVHRSGQFFGVRGLAVSTPAAEWCQPVIDQPEIGVLGILAKEFDGVLHFLMQAKMEPGNINSVQLSPTVQATWSNFTGVHRGRGVRYLEHFRPGRDRVLVDVLQSEPGSWFLGKRNRNMVVETTGEVPEHEDFRWLTAGELRALLHRDNVVNMNARSVLSCFPFAGRRDTAELRRWLTGRKAATLVRRRRVPLAGLPGWHRTADAIAHEQGRYFSIVAADVRADSREVPAWTQPLLRPAGEGLVAFLVRERAGETQVLVQARAEAGSLDLLELAPTVQCTPTNYTRPPRFLDEVLAAGPARIRFDTRLSDEGGRFHHAVQRFLLVEAADGPDEPGEGFRWTGLGELTGLVQYGYHLNMQARTLLACLQATEARYE